MTSSHVYYFDRARVPVSGSSALLPSFWDREDLDLPAAIDQADGSAGTDPVPDPSPAQADEAGYGHGV
ncbi:MAG: hypothetical protein AB7H88_14040 [Vicinamibacterales bacterium]